MQLVPVPFVSYMIMTDCYHNFSFNTAMDGTLMFEKHGSVVFLGLA